jgi:hypothetical protein
MSRNERFPELDDIVRREELYSPIWAALMDKPANTYAAGLASARKRALDVMPIARATLNAAGRPLLAKYEGGFVAVNSNNRAHRSYHNDHRVAALMQVHNAHRRIHDLAGLGFSLLANESRKWESAFAATSTTLSLVRARPFFARFYGRLLYVMGKQAGLSPKVSLSVEATKGGKAIAVMAMG